MSQMFLKYKKELNIILINGGEAFSFEDKKAIQNIILSVLLNNDDSKRNFQNAIKDTAN